MLAVIRYVYLLIESLFYECVFSDSRFAIATPPVCLEAKKEYKVKINFQKYNNRTINPSASILVDSVNT